MGHAGVDPTDELTGLPGHGALLGALEKGIDDADGAQGALSVGVVDIDYFKKVNDERGRAVGDELLKALAAHLADSVKGQGAAFRHGGDEFVVLLPGVGKEQALLLLDGVRSAFQREHELAAGGERVTLAVSISIGIASYPEDGSRGQDVLRKAGDAMFRAKAGDRNKVCLAREERMVTKTSHYTQGQLQRLGQLAKREGVGEAILLREALDELLRKYTLM